MAISFDESNDYYSISDDASLTLPDGDWCVGIWTKLDDNSGSAYQYLISNNNYSVNNSFNLAIQETGYGGALDDCWAFYVEDGDGTFFSEYASTVTGGDSKWRLIVVQRDTTASELQMYFCEPGSAATKEVGVADTNFNAVNGGDWNIGRRVDGNANRYYGGIAAEFWKGDFVLSQAEIEALGAGLPIHALGHEPDIYLPMISAEATLEDIFGSNDATRQDTPTSTEHGPVGLPAGAIVTTREAAVVGANVPQKYYHYRHH